jgi:hypothetical protein
LCLWQGLLTSKLLPWPLILVQVWADEFISWVLKKFCV